MSLINDKECNIIAIADLRARCDVAVGGDVALGPRQASHHTVVPEHDLQIGCHYRRVGHMWFRLTCLRGCIEEFELL